MEQQSKNLGSLAALRSNYALTKPEEKPDEKPAKEIEDSVQDDDDDTYDIRKIKEMKPFERRLKYEALIAQQKVLVQKIQKLAALPDTKDFTYMIHRMNDIHRYIMDIKKLQAKKQPFEFVKREQRGY